jgi:hypothetical protein
MTEKGSNIAIIILSIIIGILFILLIVVSYAYVDSDEDWYYVYDELDREWCGYSNDQAELYNDAVDWLIYYDDEIWDDSLKMELIDCWER